MRGLGIDLGGSKLLACLVDESGGILGQVVLPTGRGTGPAEARRLIVGAAKALRDEHGAFDTAGIGFPGQVDYPRGLVHGSILLDGWVEVPLARQIAELLEVPCVVDNDVNAAAMAELKHREADPPTSMLFVAVGTGIGGAITLGNRLWRGHTGVAGEIGNMTIDRHGAKCWCGRRGCLNTSASGTAMEGRLEPSASLAEHVRMGHPRLAEVVEDAARALGIGVANAINLLNPALVVLGGGVAELGDRWLDTVIRTARADAFPEAADCRFEMARAGYEAGAVGAALLGMGAATTTSASRKALLTPAATGGPAPS